MFLILAVLRYIIDLDRRTEFTWSYHHNVILLKGHSVILHQRLPTGGRQKTGEQQFALMLWSVLVHFSLWMLYSTVFCLSDFLTHSPKRRAVGGTGWYILLPNAPNRLDTVLCTTPCVLTISSSIRRSLIIKDDKMWTCKLQVVQFKSRQYRCVPKWFRRVALLMMTTRGTNRVRLSSQNTCGNTSAHASSNKENGFIFTSELHSVLSKI